MKRQSVNQKSRFLAIRRAFTLLELLVVMSIIVILASILTVAAMAARNAMAAQNTLVVMGQGIVIANKLFNDGSAIKPDHRLANFYWIQPHVTNAATTPTFNSGQAIQMSSTQFFTYIALTSNVTQAATRVLGSDYLKPPQIPAWGTYTGNGQVWPDNNGNLLVDVFLQNPGNFNLQYKQSCPTMGMQGVGVPGAATYALQTGRNGYLLNSIYDAWGHELIYRAYVNPAVLNGSFSTATVVPTYGQSLQQLEAIVGDNYGASTTPVRWDKGVGSNGSTNGAGGADCLWDPAVSSFSSVIPALAASDFPYFASAGPNGLWGSFLYTTGGSAADPYHCTVNGSTHLLRDGSGDLTERDPNARDNLYSFDRFGR